MAQFLNVDYIAVFDDDTIPGPRWFENCLKTLEETGPALLGTCGQSYQDGDRRRREGFGWKRPFDAIVEVDIVEHAWFFPRKLLLGWTDAPYLEFPTCGEQYYLPLMAQRHGMKAYCPPHPDGDKSWWGSVNGELGVDEHALYLQPGEDEKKLAVHARMLELGWKPQAVRVEEGESGGRCVVTAMKARWLTSQASCSPLESIRNLGITPKFMLDCGPGLPNTEAWDAEKLWPGITIIGFEPQPDRFMSLVHAKYPGHLTPYAVTAISGQTVKLKHHGANINASLWPGSLGDGREWDARTITLDDVIALRPDMQEDGLLWLDIEGAEALALLGAQYALERCCAVVVEVWPTTRDEGWCSADEVAVHLTKAGFHKAAEFPSLGQGDVQRDEVWVRT